MKVLIAADMEGVTGVVSWDQVTPGSRDYERFRRLLTADINAAVRGAFAAGATDVIVSDGHGGSNQNVLLEELDDRAHLNSGETAPLGGLQGAARDVGAAMFVGYHARAGTPNAVLDHTFSPHRVGNLWLDDELIGEVGLNALICAYFGVPLVLITGDVAACDEATAVVAGVERAIVKRATGRYSADCSPPAVSQSLIEHCAALAVGHATDPSLLAPLGTWPRTMSLEFVHTEHADRAIRLQGAARENARTVRARVDDPVNAYRTLRTLLALSAAFVPPTDAR